MDHDLLTPAQAAQCKGVSRTAIYSAIAEGRLKHNRILGRLAIKREHLLAWSPMRYAGRPKGKPMTDEAKARLSESQKRRWSQHKR
ncbi:MAG: helix-turn-helix domain-containing protein [Abitibacteriaceae bacterium]|nr:helix-turn-helix domain-containing protein [Abditibacteriaceae bacterium]